MFAGCRSLSSAPMFNTSSAKDMGGMFYFCTSLSSAPLYDTSRVTGMNNMFANCSTLTSVPLFDTSKVWYMDSMFYDCRYVQHGALALYQQASSQTNKPWSHEQTFRNCGTNTQTGSAELAQIPSYWK